MSQTMRVLRFVPAVIWAAALFWASSRSDLPAFTSVFPAEDKLLHAAAFGALAGWLLFGDGFPAGWRVWLWVGVVALYGFSDELHQSFVPGRSANITDWLADVLGASVCAVVLPAVVRRWRGGSREITTAARP